MQCRRASSGYSLVEITVSIVIAALLVTAAQRLLSTGISATTTVKERTDIAREARFAMGRMVGAVRSGPRLLLPLADNPATNWDEHVRVQTVPASPPQGSSTLATAVLAVTLDRAQDMDLDGVFDADNDGDGRFDEDPHADTSNDQVAGIAGVDDDGDGSVDETDVSGGPAEEDDDEDAAANEDGWNAADDDGDGLAGEDPESDLTGDGLPGIGGVDDDGDGSVDEGDQNDDDEDGSVNEDWFDPVVFYLQGSALIERRAVPWDENDDSIVDGRDFVESTIADNVTLLRFERLPPGAGDQLVDITLEITASDGAKISLNTSIRVGGAP